MAARRLKDKVVCKVVQGSKKCSCLSTIRALFIERVKKRPDLAVEDGHHDGHV